MENTNILRRCAIIVASVIVSALMIASPVSANGFTEPGMVKDIDPSGNSSPEYFTVMGSTLFFSAYDATTGRELWKSDGTEAGTVMVKDICSGVGNSSFPSYLAAMGNTLFFTANDGTYGNELWKSDGTEAGTEMVKDINPSGGPVGGSWPDNLVVIGSTLFFEADDGTNGYELWMSDGTEAGTEMVKDINPGIGNSFPYYLTAMGGMLFFQAYNATTGNELWMSDGTAEGTVMVKDINPDSGSSDPYYFTAMGGTLFFGADNGISGAELWMSDGTETGTVMVKDINLGNGGSAPGPFTVMGSTLFFSAFNTTTGRELWKSDGTEVGTVMVKDIYPGSEGSSVFEELVVMDDTLFFQANDGTNGSELWRSDGTEVGTVMVKNINPGSGYSFPYWLAAIGGALFFQADDGTNGNELWKSDGTEAGTVMVKDINYDTGSYPSYLTVIGGTLFFSANDGDHGYELWKLEALPTNSIVNGSFETRDYTGWILLEDSGYPDYGTWGIAQDGDVVNYLEPTYDFCDGVWVPQHSDGLPITYNATDGNYLAYQLQNDAETHRMYQDITLSPSAENLTWDIWYTNWAEEFDPDFQYLAVNVRDPSDDSIIETLFKTTEGIDPYTIPMTSFSRDISAYAGTTVRLDIEMSVYYFYFDAAFDNFAIEGAITGGKLFMVDAYNSTICELDPATGAMLNTIPTPVTAGECDGLAYGNDRMFFVSCNATVYDIYPSDGDILNQFDVSGALSIDALGFSGDKLYALEYGSEPTIHVLDPDTGANLTTLQPGVPLVGGLTFAGTRESLFVSDANNSTIYEIDAETGAVLNSFPAIVGSGEGLLGLGFSSSRDTLFLGFEENNMIYEVDPDDGNVINAFKGPEGAIISALAADEYGVTEGLNVECAVSPNPTTVGQVTNFTAEASGGIGDYSWSWTVNGTEVATTQNTTYTFVTAGDYTVCVNVTDSLDNKMQCCKNVTVNEILSLECLISPNPTKVGHVTNFTAEASGGIGDYSWSWMVNGTEVATTPNTTYNFATAGNYTVCVNVTDSLDNKMQCCKNVTVNEILSLECVVSPNPTKVGQVTNFTAGAGGGVPPYLWSWTVNGTQVATTPNTTYNFTAAGNYTVCVNVTDSLGNNKQCCRNVTVTVSEYSVDIDIKPGVFPNDINLRSKGKLVPVAILTTPGFNASIVDPSTVEFAGAAPVKWEMVDVPELWDSRTRKYIGDGDTDLLLYFKTGQLQLTSASTEATLTGETFGGVPIEGTDSVNIVKA